MSASREAKKAGLRSLRQMSMITGKPERTLYDWFNDDPKMFHVALLGCVERLKQDEAANKYDGEPYLTAEQLDEVRYRIQSEIDGYEISARSCKQSQFDSGGKAMAEKILGVIEENLTDGER